MLFCVCFSSDEVVDPVVLKRFSRRPARAPETGAASPVSCESKSAIPFSCSIVVLNGSKIVALRRVVVEIHQHLGNLPDQLTQHLALYRSEIKKTVQHQQLNVLQPGQTTGWPSSWPFRTASARSWSASASVKLLRWSVSE